MGIRAALVLVIAACSGALANNKATTMTLHDPQAKHCIHSRFKVDGACSGAAHIIMVAAAAAAGWCAGALWALQDTRCFRPCR